jgi:hypothetical protein
MNGFYLNVINSCLMLTERKDTFYLFQCAKMTLKQPENKEPKLAPVSRNIINSYKFYQLRVLWVWNLVSS